jgi:uncharacterized DUF497 family protein
LRGFAESRPTHCSYDPAKRAKVLADRGIDFTQAGTVFAGPVAEMEDTRRDYGERRFVTAGLLGDRVVVIVFTHGREEALWRQRLG